MKTAKHAVPAVLSLLLLPASAQTYAQAETIADCQAIQDRLARYACYDSWDAASGELRPSAPRARAQPAQPAAAPAQATQPAAASAQATTERAPESAVADFGRPQSNARIVEGPDGESELIDTVAALEQLGPNMWVITLEGGQQWKQMLTKRYALQVGDEVRIYPTRWGGSYRLGSERLGGYIQVERIDSGAERVANATPAPRAQAEAAPVQEQEEERSLLGRLFNRDADDDEAAIAAPAASSDLSSASSVENFGRPQADARLVDGAEGSELIDSVAALEQLGPNLWLITLEGGQRWQQMLSKRYSLQEGDEIRIYPTKWGSSFRLSSPRLGGYIQVERVD